MNRTLLALLAWSVPLSCLPASTNEWTIGMANVGPLQIGMPLERVNELLGEHFAEPKVPGRDPTGRCFEESSANLPGVMFMFRDKRLVRLDLSKPGPKTIAGIGVGSPLVDLLVAYGDRVKVEDHTYLIGGHYFRVFSSDKKRALIFDEERGTIVAVAVAQDWAIHTEEGCARAPQV